MINIHSQAEECRLDMANILIPNLTGEDRDILDISAEIYNDTVMAKAQQLGVDEEFIWKRVKVEGDINNPAFSFSFTQEDFGEINRIRVERGLTPSFKELRRQEYWSRDNISNQKFKGIPVDYKVTIDGQAKRPAQALELFMGPHALGALEFITNNYGPFRMYRVLKRHYRGFENEVSDEVMMFNIPGYRGVIDGQDIKYHFTVAQHHPFGHTFEEGTKAMGAHFNLRGVYLDLKNKSGKTTFNDPSNSKKYEVDILYESKGKSMEIPGTRFISSSDDLKGIFIEVYEEGKSLEHFFDILVVIKEEGKVLYDGSFRELQDQHVQILENSGFIKYGEINNFPKGKEAGHIFYGINENGDPALYTTP
jgi:hypothetical protein